MTIILPRTSEQHPAAIHQPSFRKELTESSVD
jgi:hypothetical protein